MPVTHRPAGSPQGGQFAPGGSSSSSSSRKKPQRPTGLSPATVKFLRAYEKARRAAADTRLPDLSGVPKKDRAKVSKYLRALSTANKKKLRSIKSTVDKAQRKARSAAKKKAAQAARDKANAARAAAANRADALRRTNRG